MFLRDARQKVLNSFKSDVFPLTHFTPESTLVPSSNQTIKSKAQITTIQQKKTKTIHKLSNHRKHKLGMLNTKYLQQNSMKILYTILHDEKI